MSAKVLQRKLTENNLYEYNHRCITRVCNYFMSQYVYCVYSWVFVEFLQWYSWSYNPNTCHELNVCYYYRPTILLLRSGHDIPDTYFYLL